MTNQEFIIKCGHWFSNLFDDTTINVHADTTINQPVSMSYFGAAPTIKIPSAYVTRSEEIPNLYEIDTGKLFLLLIACHELVHLLYYHHDPNTINTSSRMSATELWADFYGAIIFFYLAYSNDELITSILLLQHQSEDNLLATYGCAVESLLSILESAQNSEKYPATVERSQAMIAGPLSYFGRAKRYTSEHEKIWAMMKINGKTRLMEFAFESDFNPNNMDLLQSCRESHLALMNNEYSILPKMRSEVKDLISPEFVQKPSQGANKSSKPTPCRGG
jgi:hypothetical protein